MSNGISLVRSVVFPDPLQPARPMIRKPLKRHVTEQTNPTSLEQPNSACNKVSARAGRQAHRSLVKLLKGNAIRYSVLLSGDWGREVAPAAPFNIDEAACRRPIGGFFPPCSVRSIPISRSTS